MAGPGTRAPLRSWAATFAVATTVGVFLGLLGPFGSFFNGTFWERIGYWTFMSWLGLAVFGGGAWLILQRLGSRPAGWAALCAYALVMCAPFSLISWFIASGVWPELRRVRHLSPLVWYLECLLITVLQVTVTAAVLARRAAGVRKTALEIRLPSAEPEEVLCLQMEDHYVRVHTARGSRLVLATLSQAVVALARTPGLRVHRSWWVAEKAVAGAVMEGRNRRLVLTNGVSAPVARASVAAVRAAGWLDRDLADPEESAALAG